MAFGATASPIGGSAIQHYPIWHYAKRHCIDSLPPPPQKACLHGVATMDGQAVYSNEFSERTGIRNPGTIAKALKRLQRSRIVHDSGGGSVFASPFLKLWLLRHPHF